MSTNVGSIDLELLLSSNKFNKQLKNTKNIADNASNSISKSLLKIGKAAIAAFSVKKIFDFGKECINLGSDLAEVQNVVDVSFATMNESVNAFAENAIEQFGLSQTVTKKYMGTFGAMSKAFGFAEKDAFEMSKALTGLAGDVASFYNMSSDEAYTKLKSVFTGETETLKELGVVMTQSALDQYALANGYGKTTSKMSEQEKVALRYKFVMDQLALASGDFTRTQDNWANQTRVLTLRFSEFKATVGQGLINLFTPVLKIINTLLAKLQVLANAFKSFSEFISGTKQESSGGASSISNDLSSVTDNAMDASGAVGGIGSSAKKAAKDLKSLASFDTAQILKSDKDDSSSGSSGGAGGNIDFGNLNLDDVNKSTDTMIDNLDGIKSKFLELANIFKKGFNISFGDTNFDEIFNHLKNIKNAVIDIWTDSAVINSINDWVKRCIYSLGQFVGSVSRIGINIAEGLVGSIDTYLSQNTDRIKSYICKMFDISSEDISLTGNLWQALGEISDVFSGDTAKQIGADIIAMFANPFMSVTELIFKFSKDFRSLLIQPIIDNIEELKEALSNTLEPIKTITDTLAGSFTKIGDKWNEVYDEHIGPLMESLKEGLSDTFGKFLDSYNTYVAPALQAMADKFSEVWENDIQPMLERLSDFIGKIADLVKVLWETCLKPAIDWFAENVLPVLVPIFEKIWDTICTIFGDIADTIDGVIETFNGLIDFIVGVFTGDWKKAWDGIKSIFTGIWDTIKGFCKTIADSIMLVIETIVAWVSLKIAAFATGLKVIFEGIKTVIVNVFNGIWTVIKGVINLILGGIEKMANGVIKGLNMVISALNKVSFNIPDWIPGVGGKKFGFNISQMSTISIPRLANGGFFKANQPTLAMVGDNKSQGEIVSPMNKMEEAFQNVLARNGLSSNKEIIELLKTIIQLLKDLGFDFNLFIDGKELNKRLEKIRNKRNFATNGG